MPKAKKEKRPLKETLRCIHRHTIDEHPACFANAELSTRQINLLAKEFGVPWYQLPMYRIGYFDIEVDNLKADFGTMLSWAVKEKGGKNVYDVVTKKELFNHPEAPDLRILKSLINELRKYKIIVGYYSTGFDFPFIRAKAVHYGLDFPEFGELYHFDLYYTIKSKFALSRKSLAVATNYFGIEGKTPLDPEIWRMAKYGDKKALEMVVEHNLADTDITEQLHDKIAPFRKWTRKSI